MAIIYVLLGVGSKTLFTSFENILYIMKLNILASVLHSTQQILNTERGMLARKDLLC